MRLINLRQDSVPDNLSSEAPSSTAFASQQLLLAFGLGLDVVAGN
jgi:hypothetical protein